MSLDTRTLYARAVADAVAVTDPKRVPDVATLTPDEARTLAVELLSAAEDVEK